MLFFKFLMLNIFSWKSHMSFVSFHVSMKCSMNMWSSVLRNVDVSGDDNGGSVCPVLGSICSPINYWNNGILWCKPKIFLSKYQKHSYAGNIKIKEGFIWKRKEKLWFLQLWSEPNMHRFAFIGKVSTVW